LKAGKKRFSGDMEWAATVDEGKNLRTKNSQMQEALAEQKCLK